MADRIFRIHPAIGVARVGDSPDDFYVGPLQPGVPANWNGQSFDSFRDQKGRIKRQAAEFRVFEYEHDNQGRLVVKGEVKIGDGVSDIEWRVHVANKKASFFTFNGQSGADDTYVTRSKRLPDSVEKEKAEGQPERLNLRNAKVPSADRTAKLEIDPGEKLISKATGGPAELKVNNSNIPAEIPTLGRLSMESDGRLRFLGGNGRSGSTDPNSKLDEYANNDTWFDDMSDGSVKARIILADGTKVDADAAWVIVGPPGFVPAIDNSVTLYDTVWDVAVRKLALPPDAATFINGPLSKLAEQKRAWDASSNDDDEKSLAGYRPSFTKEIYPILKRAVGARFVHDPGEADRTYHMQLLDWDLLSQPDNGTDTDNARDLRQYVFSRMRDPFEKTEVDWNGMPRGLGDDYDKLDAESPIPTSFLSLTRIQYSLLREWAKGNFDADWPKQEPGIPSATAITPDGLDRSALENCVGGPFFPGIEISWLIRRADIYAEPFRLRLPKKPEPESAEAPAVIGVLPFGPGFFSQQMALPWQADFYDCHKEEHEDEEDVLRLYMWWTAQRPDDVFPKGQAQKEQVRWVRAFDGATTVPGKPDSLENLARFEQMQKNWSTLGFVLPEGDEYVEVERIETP